ncbi:MAG: FG-GAP-like repeat-containing protein [Bacteroidia bacterium]
MMATWIYCLRGDLGDSIPSTTLYINNGGQNFDEANDFANQVAQVRKSSVVWGDYDNDNDLDILISGKNTQLGDSRITHLYENRDGTFVLDQTASDVLVNVAGGANAFGDYDNDGDLDILITGEDINKNRVTRLYRNDGQSKFTDVTSDIAGIVGISGGSVAWGDYNRDGFLDFVITGEISSSSAITSVFKNLGDGKFADAGFTSLQNVKNSKASWADYDQDSYLDLLVTGELAVPSFQPLTRIYRYDAGNDVMVPNLTSQLEDISRGSAIRGDFDNDGYVDILLSGKNGAGAEARTTRLYRNDKAGNFNEDVLSSADLEDVDLGATVFGDYNGDQKLDIILTGRTSTVPAQRSFAVFRNIDGTPNTTLGAPKDLNSTINGTEVTLSWKAPDLTNPDIRSGLTYNVYLGTRNDLTSKVSPMSEIGGSRDGYRKLVSWGNMGTNTSMTLTDFPDGTYYWSVQVVDQDFEGSPFAAADSFSFQNPIPMIIDSSFVTEYKAGQDTVSYIQVLTDTIISEVVVKYKGIAQETWKQEVIPSDNGTYRFAINANKVDEMGVEYVFEVLGTFGFNLSTDTIYAYRRYPQGFDFSNLDFGKEVINYNLLSIPLRLDNNAINQILDPVLGEYDIYKWRFWHYQGGKHVEYKSGISSIEEGKGYWLITKDEHSFNSGGGLVVESNDSHPFVISLVQGWNQIGNPYPYNLAWQDVLEENPDAASVLDELLLFNRGYQNGSVIARQRGAFVFANSPIDLKIPVRKNLSVQRIPRSRSFQPGGMYLSDGTWSLDIALRSGNWTYPLGGIGMHPQADSSKDRFDQMTAPRLSEYLEMNFDHPEYFEPKFSRDIVPVAKNHVWEFTVNSNLEEEEVDLDWDFTELKFAGQKLILFDVERQLAIDMEEYSQYTSRSKRAERKFRIYYGSESFIADQLKPDFVSLGLAYPNPSAGKVTIPFALPSSMMPYQVELAIYSVSGQEIRRLGAENLREGFHQLEWDGNDETGNRVSRGVYLYKLNVLENGKVTQLTGRMIMN